MTKWTKEQEEAIYKEGMPILVSAGAGSGKTAVLTERVLRKIKEGVSLQQLLILTFTKAAAHEMKERIRLSLLQENMHTIAEQVDAAYITTFDSFAFSIVKKYHYLLGVPSNVSIVDSSMINLQKERLLDQIFDRLYEKRDSNFEYMIEHFCTKDDDKIKSDIINMHNKLDLKYDKIEFLNSYIDNEMCSSHFMNEIDEYMKVILNQIEELLEHVNEMKQVDDDYFVQVFQVLEPLFNARTYEEVRKCVQVSFPRVPANNEPLKAIKDAVGLTVKELKRLTRWETKEDIVHDLEDTKLDIQVLISILLELEEKLSIWKYENNAFEFHDIAKLAIRVVQENISIQNELRESWNEILLDEYQDTSDLQERFIDLIANHNVYMVGDMKQSIYRFRNANPSLFKDKYDRYRFGKDGIKIDLIQNFRSRKEPLDDINEIFNRILLDETGGVDYEKEHQMVFGNQIYEDQKSCQNMHMCILNYDKDEAYTKVELEAFIVAQDIESKVNQHFQVLDSKTRKLRDVQYQDFVILMDRASQFDVYKQVFEYKKIPLAVHKDETITSGMELKLVYHILRCMEKMELHSFDTEWQYSFMSLMRSYLLEEADDLIFDCLRYGEYENSRLYEHIKNLLLKKNGLNNELLLEAIIEEFDFYECFIKVGNVEDRIVKMEYLLKMAENLSKMGYDCYGMMNYLKDISDKNYEIRFSKNLETENSVSIMTIHKSKGLEYPICYYTGLFAKFNKADVKERMTYDDTVGFMVPVVRNGIQNTIRKDLLRYYYQKQEIAEKIRLFYVALTRSKEQIIMVLPRVDEEFLKCSHIKPYQAFHFHSFLDMIKSIYGVLFDYEKNVRLDGYLSKDYKMYTQFSNCLELGSDTLVVQEVDVQADACRERTFSKTIQKPLDYQQYRNIELGRTLHRILECLDFLHPDYTDISPFFERKIRSFLSCSLFQENIIYIYKEYEFYSDTEKEQFHGIIDLMIEYESEIKIVDYKLKQIVDDDYLKQLRGYESYMETITDKKISTYLYSILDETLEEVNVLAFSE